LRRSSEVVRKEDDAAGADLYAQPVATNWRSHIHAADIWIAVGFVVAAATEVVIRYRYQPVQLAIDLPGSLVFGVLAVRRVRPLLTMTVFTAAAAVASVVEAVLAPSDQTDAVVPIFALLLASYSLGAHATRRELLLGVLQPVGLILVVDLSAPANQSLAGAVVFFAVFVDAAPVLAGRLVRGRSTLIRELRAQAAELLAQGQARSEAARARERLRLASELHLTLVHGMESLVARADAAREMPTEGERAVADIEEAARALLARTRHAVVSLASSESSADVEIPAAAASPADTFEHELRSRAQPWTVLAGAGLAAGLFAELRTLPTETPMTVAMLACIVVAVPLALTWLHPLFMTALLWATAAVFVVAVASLDNSLTAVGLSFVPPFLVAALEGRRRAVAGLLVCAAGEVACFGAPSNLLIVGCCWLAGVVFHERSRLVDELHRNNQLLAEQREAASQQAAFDERARMARDLHDAIGHNLTVIALQAGAARRLWTGDITKAEAALDTISRVVHDGLAELRSGFDVSSTDGLPPPWAASLETLIRGAREAGLDVVARIDDATLILEDDARHAAFRVVQESLTNVLKHAAGATAEVTVRDVGKCVEIVVRNTVTGLRAVGVQTARRGLIGMQQRVEACGGTLAWGQTVAGRFEVRAEIPTARVSA
jgi:signal transduction histidine kinase